MTKSERRKYSVAAYSILDSALSRLKVNTRISQHSVIQTNPFMNTLITSTCGFRSFPSRLLFQIIALEKAPESLPFGEWRWKLYEQARKKLKTVFLAFNYDLINKQFESHCAHYKRHKHRRVSVITRHFNFVLFPWALLGSFCFDFSFNLWCSSERKSNWERCESSCRLVLLAKLFEVPCRRFILVNKFFVSNENYFKSSDKFSERIWSESHH